jgi:tartrate-resistant acid phosphatase type 5
VDNAIVHFIVVDTMSFILRKHDPDRQLAWLEELLQRSPADWIILIGHHPPYSAGGHAPGTVTMRDVLVPLCNKYGVDVLLNGDEHNFEHITSSNVTDYVISGGGGRGLYEFSPAGERILKGWDLTVNFFGYYFGFVAMEIKKTTMTLEFVDTQLNVRYSFTRNK